MNKLLILGAGRSSSSLIKYLIEHKDEISLELTIGEKDPDVAKKKFPELKVVEFDILDTEKSISIIQGHQLVISMLPASLHFHAAKICAAEGIHFITASYLTKEIQALAPQFSKKGACCVMEMGLDPGIDHMSAMQVLDRIKSAGHTLTAFETFTGGLLDEATEKENPWQYKFTWNPRNVVMAGTGAVKFIQEGKYKYIPYHRLFKRTEVIHIPGHGYYEGYANRDSLQYLELYNLQGIETLFRGTLRRVGYCKAWDIFVQLGATDDDYKMENVSKMSHRQFVNSFLSYNPHDSVELKLAHYLSLGLESDEMFKLKWLGLFDEELIGLQEGTPAQILEHILKKKWTLQEGDKDRIVMWHKFDYLENGRPKQIQAHMVATGDDLTQTAMSKTVGLPLAILAKLLITGQMNLTGVHIPTSKTIYEPVLNELESLGFEFMEREMES
ncbi:MAG: saccharopine dehydrogenase (NADP+, L-glutamate forming) [Cyclobacteriaceae bacterium]|jgi:saccharopine dehydrogenase-like NADP-dependent oxidoreductase